MNRLGFVATFKTYLFQAYTELGARSVTLECPACCSVSACLKKVSEEFSSVYEFDAHPVSGPINQVTQCDVARLLAETEVSA